MEQDEEFYKKLMALMSSNKQLTLRNGNAKKTIKIKFDVSEQPFADSINFQNSENLSVSPITSKNFIMPQQQTKGEVHDIEENDFKILAMRNQFQKNSPSISKNFDQLIQSNPLTPNELSICSQNTIVQKSQNVQNMTVSAVKPKKVLLGNKNKHLNKPANEAVLNFIQSRTLQTNKTQIISSSKQNTIESTHHFSFQRISSQQTPSKKYLSTSKQVSQSIQMLKLRHPQSSQEYEMINRRVLELQNKVQREISQILSASLNNSFRLDSFDLSILSALKLGINSDPLCEMFMQYIKRNESQKSQNKNNSASFLFLYSQPMLDIHGQQIEQQINYFQQESIIQKLLKEIKCKMSYIRQRATMDKFHYWMKQSIEILHFCGHGVQQKQNYLLFQNNIGKSVKMDSEAIGKILSEIKTQLKLVFVASCHSQSTGKLFCEAGVSHVVCVKNDHVILDEICQQFVRIFYKACIQSKMSICESFKFAKKQLQLMQKFAKHQIQKFMILHNHQKKDCNSQLTIPQAGQFKDLTQKPFYIKNLPSRVENFIPRPKDMQEILKLIDTKKRYITITGMPGIGKSTLARQLVRYIQFRNIFRDGVIYVDIRGCENMSKIVQSLDIELFQNLNLKHNRTLQENTQKIIKQLNQKHVLIVLDNCQHIMASDDKESFKKMIESMMKNCDDTYFLFTHRISISRQIDYCSQKIYQLNKLNQRQSYKLFFQAIPRNVDKHQLGEFFKIEKGIDHISKHPIFQFLNGHPQAICMTASLLSDRSLSELYELLLKPVKDLSNQLGIQETKLNYDLTSNKVVETAMKISLNVLKNKSKSAYQMIKILSMLPRGLDLEMISRIISKNYQQNLQKLTSFSLVKKYDKGDTKYYCVHPNIITYVQNQINTDEKLKYHEKICQEYLKRCERIYKNVGTLSPNSQKYQQMFLNQEDNYRAIILRELSVYGESIQLKRLYIELFQGQYLTPTYSNSSHQQQENFHSKKPLIDLSDFESYFNQTYKRAKFNQKMKQATKKQNIMVLTVYYITNLYVIKKAAFCQKYIQYGVYLSVKKNMYMVTANLIRLKGCIQLARHRNSEARQYFQLALEMFALEGCGLGAASCEGAVGYIKYLEQEYAMAKMNLQNALKYYCEIDHPFGKYYLNQWLGLLKSKMNRTENQLITHKNQAQKLLKQARSNLKSSNLNNTSIYKHKHGFFVFRFLFNNMSLFLEISFDSDVKPRLINTIVKKIINEKNDKPILIFEKQRQDRVQFQVREKDQKPKQLKQEKQQKFLKPSIVISKAQNKDEIKEQSEQISIMHLTVPSTKIQTQNQGQASLSSSQNIAVPKKKLTSKQIKPEIFKKMKFQMKQKETFQGELQKSKSKQKSTQHH